MHRANSTALAFACLLYCCVSAAEPTATDFNIAWREYSAAVDAGDIGKTLSASEQVLEIGRQVLPEKDAQLPMLMSNHATALNDAGLKDAAERMFEEAIKLAKSIHGKDSVELIDLLLAQAAASHRVSPAGRPISKYRRILRISEEHHGKESLEYAYLAYLAGSKLLNESHSMAGEWWMRDAYEIYSAAGESQAANVGATALYLGRMAYTQGHRQMAVKYLREAVDKLDPEVPAAKAMSLLARAILVRILEDQGRSEEATEHSVAIARDSMFSSDQEYLPLFQEAPRYPLNMPRVWRVQFVDLSFTVDEKGLVRDPVVIATSETPAEEIVRKGGKVKLSRPERYYADAAIEAAQRFVYAPRLKDGKAVATENVKARIKF